MYAALLVKYVFPPPDLPTLKRHNKSIMTPSQLQNRADKAAIENKTIYEGTLALSQCVSGIAVVNIIIC